MRLQIHKNDLAPFFLKDYPESTKIGEEKMRRWNDVPENIQVEVDPGQLEKMTPYEKIPDDKYCSHCMVASTLVNCSPSNCICSCHDKPEKISWEVARINELTDKVAELGRWMKDSVTWHMEFAPNLGHDPNNPFCTGKPMAPKAKKSGRSK